MKKLLCPSMMCADARNIGEEMENLEAAGADIFHLDVMDGRFVPNFGMGSQDIEFLVQHATIPCDVHLMIEEPGRYVERFAKLGAKIIYVHPESDTNITRTLQKIREAGAKAGLAVNPGTAFEMVRDYLSLVDYVLVMSVNPGFAGQKYLDFVTPKFQEFCAAQDKYGYQVVIDGACSPERIHELSQVGVTGFVLGTSALFGQSRSYQDIMPELREM